MPKYAVIDSGTNTFSLILYNVSSDGKYEKILKESVYVFLADDGLDFVSESAAQRAMNAYLKFDEIIKRYQIESIKAVGTALWRSAMNGAALATEIFNKTGIQVEIIQGNREAELIYSGVAQTLAADTANNLIIDIGGGSVELIIGQNNKMLWCKSFDLGAALLFNKFNVSDPISEQNILQIKEYVNSELQALSDILNKFPVKRIVAASGTLDALVSILELGQIPHGAVLELKQDLLENFTGQLLVTNLVQRLMIPGMLTSRAKLLPVALVLLKTILELTEIKDAILLSDYALHEGLLLEIIK
jgi:exopolyphosphatase / guanosine-5'-triphosphate,3'-diphosphate pyrophosphatase